MEALDTLITSVPEWHTLLDNLNGKISSRQIELAQIGGYRTPVPSLKNKGPTESLRPNDSTKSPIQEDIELKVSSELPPNKTRRLESPVLSASEGPPLWNPTKAAVFPPLISHSSSPGPAAASLRRTSNQIAGDALVKPILLPLARKRKTASVASNDSQGPKYRTRSMIIVYYDSEVQHAFEELVRYISSCRNGMRKGKMAARMADMKRMADLETGSSDEEDSKPNGLPTLDNKLVTSFTGGSAPAVDLHKDTLKVDGDDDIEHPKLQYISTRRMGPPAAQKNAPPTNGGTSLPQIPGNLRSNGWKRSGIGHGASSTPTSIYDELDAGLELCQSMCEHAAHQFLRDGDCSVEIAGINRRLKEVKETAEKHQKQTPKPKSEADAKPLDSGTPEIPLSVKYDGPVGGQSLTVRSLKPAQMCRTLLVQSTPPKIPGRIEVDEDIRYDEEDDCQDLIWRSTRNMGGHYNQIETITTLT